MKKNNNDLVSIVIPVYNAQDFLTETIDSVLAQTYENWEIILVNDCSKDNSKKVAKPYLKDKRIKWVDLKTNSGVATARNTGTEMSKGRYLCFLDADDKWLPDKLEKEIKFIKDNDYAFIYASYEFADQDCKPNGKKVIVPEKMRYRDALKNTVIWTSTVMLDMTKITKEDVHMPNIRSGQDAATWWQILKKIDYAYGMRDIVAYYRRTNNSLSANKFKAVKRTWMLYRKVEKLGFFYSCYNFIFYCFNAVKRRI